MPEDKTTSPPAQPLLRVINADATDEEIAAIVAVFSALGGGDNSSSDQPRREWAAAYRQTRVPNWHGRGGWRASSLPKHRGR